MWFLAWGSVGLAYESDTLTEREQPLPDVTDQLDEWVNLVIRESIDATNEKTQCRQQDPDQVIKILGKEIHDRTAANEMVNDRGGLRAFGFDRLSAWIEKGGVPHRAFDDRRDIFGSLTFKESPLLLWAGVCSTVRVNGVLVGSDKLDHFFEEGFKAWKRARWGEEPLAGVEWAVKTENGKYGLSTSEAFSFGDLRADDDGTTFYETLLDPGGVAVIGEDGCLDLAEPFTWRDWVNWEYDEVLNPPVYTPEVQQGVTRHLAMNREVYCASYESWGGPDYEEHLRAVLTTPPAYSTPDAPPRTDPFRLGDLCRSQVH